MFDFCTSFSPSIHPIPSSLFPIWLMGFSKALVPDKEMTAPLRQLQNSTEASPICLSLIEILNSSESLITLVNVARDFDDFTSQVVALVKPNSLCWVVHIQIHIKRFVKRGHLSLLLAWMGGEIFLQPQKFLFRRGKIVLANNLWQLLSASEFQQLSTTQTNFLTTYKTPIKL